MDDAGEEARAAYAELSGDRMSLYCVEIVEDGEEA